MRSSTFSSKSLHGFKPKLPAALLLAVGVLVGLELGMRALPDWFLMKAGGWLGELYYAEHVVLPRGGPPSVVFLGSSTTQAAVVPAVVEGELGLPAGGVANLAIRGGRPFDALTLYRRQREVLAQAQVIVLCLDTWTFNVSFAATARYRLHAPLPERLAYAEGVAFVGSGSPADQRRRQDWLANQRQRLLADSVFNMRVLLPYVQKSAGLFLHLRKQRKYPSLLDDGRMRVSREITRGPEELEGGRALLELRAGERCADYGVQPLFVDHVRELGRLIREDGGQLVLLQLPCRAAYEELVEELHPQALESHLATTRALAQELDVPFEFWQRPAECGLTETSYKDYGHVGEEGAHQLSVFLAQQLRERGWLSKR